MNIKFKIYEILKQNPLKRFTALDIARKFHSLSPTYEILLIKLSMNYPAIKAVNVQGTKYFYYSREEKK